MIGRKTIRQLLVEIAEEPNASRLARIVAYNYVDLPGRRESLFSAMFRYYKISDFGALSFDRIKQRENELQKAVDVPTGDYRIKSVTLSNIRGIPQEVEGIPFGINFEGHSGNGKTELNSAIILAGNGTGKSSIFGSLEMIYAREIGEKKLRSANPDLKPEDFSDYLQHFPSSLHPVCNVSTKAGNFSLQNPVFPNDKLRDQVSPRNHFISDFDIYDSGKREFGGDSNSKQSFHYLVANSLGLGEFMKMRDTFLGVVKYARTTERRQIQGLEKDHAELESRLSTSRNLLKQKREKLIELGSLKKFGPPVAKVSPEYKLLMELIDRPVSFDINRDSYLKAVTKFMAVYLTNLNLPGNDLAVSEKLFLEKGLEIVHDLDDCPFCQSSRLSKQQLLQRVEARVRALREALEIENQMQKAYEDAFYQIRTFYAQCRSLFDIISNERAEFSKHYTFNHLESLYGFAYVRLSLIVADEALFSYLNNPATGSDKKRFEYLFNIVDNNRARENGDVITLMHEFKRQRNEEFEIARKRLSEDVSGELSEDRQETVLLTEVGQEEARIKDLEIRISASQKQINDLKTDMDLMADMKNELDDFMIILNSRIDSMIQTEFNVVKKPLEDIMNIFLKKDELRFSVTTQNQIEQVGGIQEESNVIVAILEPRNPQVGITGHITPDQYFNTFRYKLFCLTVSVSMALVNRRRYAINLPLIIDDVFFGSDFVSKSLFTDFFQRILETFHTFNPDMPLQFILFTHDEVIFQSAMEAVARTRIENHYLIDSTMTGKLFPPSDRADDYSVLPDGRRFWNLFYDIPDSVSVLNAKKSNV